MSPEPHSRTQAAPRFILSPSFVLPLFASTLFTGALLIFWVEPMFTKMVLPLLGGSPSVWNTAVMFFQGVLLAGYSYAHFLTKLRSHRAQAILHLTVLAAATVCLPVVVAPGWTPPSDGTPILWLLGLLAYSLGLPFFAIAATAPLLQRWFVISGHESARDPYFLYGASNLGSLVALLSYPALVEPQLRLGEQSWGWSAGYGLLMILVGLSALSIWRAQASVPDHSTETAQPSVTVEWRRRIHWMFLAFAPSSLLLGVTTHMSTDIAAIPLLWVVPLTLYLLTFVIAFARRPMLRHDRMIRIQPFLVLSLAAGFWFHLPPAIGFPLHLATFFVTTMVCHGELNRCRPETRHLTEFYFWMSFGGLLGGAFNVLAAPLMFNGVLEYPIALALACMLRPRPSDQTSWLGKPELLLPAAILAFVPLKFGAAAIGIDPSRAAFVVFCLLFACGLPFLVRRRPLAFGGGIAACLLTGSFLLESNDLLTRERSFFGIHTVKRDSSGQFNLLIHGTTVHGAELLDASRRREPQTYYLRDGPFGQIMAALAPLGRPANVAIIGLGLGSTTCYKAPGQRWTVFEIDPVVERLARDTRYFHFMADCAGDTRVVIGDGRLSLTREPDGTFDLLALDAFSSDAIPMHLMTREALRLYFDKLSFGGIIALHISNRTLNLEPVVANLAFDAGAVALIQRFRPDDELRADNLAKGTDWVLLARQKADLAFIADDPRWSALAPRPVYGLWTDDFSNVLEIYRWN
ncbi:MAG: spermidine synthase [Dongiaceae bacterium]